MKKNLHILLPVFFMAGHIFAELPTSTLAPSGESHTSQDIKSYQSQLNGKVVELRFNRAYHPRRISPKTYEANLLCYDQESNTANIQIPEDGLDFFLQFAFKEANMGDVHAKKTTPDTSVYALIDHNQLIALGDKCSKNEDGSAVYSWSKKTELPDKEDFMKKDEWSVTELALYGHNIIGQEVEVTCCVINPLAGIESTSVGNYQAQIGSGFGHATLKVDFSGEDAHEFFKEIEDEGHTSETLFTFYARVNAHNAHDIELSALGTRSRGKGLKRTYRW